MKKEKNKEKKIIDIHELKNKNSSKFAIKSFKSGSLKNLSKIFSYFLFSFEMNYPSTCQTSTYEEPVLILPADILTLCQAINWHNCDHRLDMIFFPEIPLLMIPILFLMHDIDGLVQDCSNSIAKAMELLQSWAKQSQ